MKKIHLVCLLGTAALLIGVFPALAENNAGNPSVGQSAETKAMPPQSVKATEDKMMPPETENVVQGSGKEYFACMAKATSTREESFMAGLSAFNSSVASAYSARKAALASAWSSSEERDAVQKNIAAAEKAFRESYSTSQKQWTTTQQTIAKQFNTERAACAKLSATQPTNTSQQSLLERIKQLEAQIKELMTKLNLAPQPTATAKPETSETSGR